MEIKTSLNKPVTLKAVNRDEQLQKQLEEVATGIEEQFANLLIQEMKKSVDKTEEGSSAMKIYESYLDQEYARVMANQKTLGLSDIVVEQLAPSLKAKPATQPQVNRLPQGGSNDRN